MRFTAITILLTLLLMTASQAATPKKWPFTTLQIGLMDEEGGAAALKANAPFGVRYHYLAGGVNTSDRWQTWAHGGGSFVSEYVADSIAYGQAAMFTYYELRQSQPGAANGDEPSADLSNLTNRDTMRAWYEDFKRLMQVLGDTGAPVVVQVEPDLWGYVQQRYGDHGGTKAPASVASSGMPELSGLPNTASGVARAAIALRNQYAPAVRLAYPISIWGTKKDITYSDEPLKVVNRLAARTVTFYKSLHARFDALFGECADRTSGYAQNHDGQDPDKVWWSKEDFARHLRFFSRFHKQVKLPITLWQIPLGNTKTLDNSYMHYQDNRLQWFLDPRHRYAKLRAYRKAGIVALLFGPGQSEDTHADADGGFLYGKVKAYYARGALTI